MTNHLFKNRSMLKAPVRILFLTGALLFLISTFPSCSGDYTSDNSNTDPYIEKLSDLFTEKIIMQQTISLSNDVFEPSIIELTIEGNNFVVSDFAQKKLFLLSYDGEILSNAGGIGRGPGEFELITEMHIGSDNHVYVHDGILKRITIYKVVDGEFILLDTKNYKNPDFYTLYRLFVTKYGIYGLYNESEGFYTPKNRFHLYLLDRDFNPVEKRLNFPGEQRPPVNTAGFLLYSPHDYSNRYLWHQSDSMFYYTNNYDALIKGYNFKKEKSIVLFEASLPERPSNDYYINAADDAYDFASNRDYWSVLENLETLPVLSGVWSDSTNIVLSIRPAPGDEIMMLYVDLEKEDINYFMLPEGTGASVLRQNIFYSIRMDKDGRNYLMITNLEP